MIETIIACAASFVLSVSAVGLILSLSRKKSWFDHTNERKIHTGDIPRLGGAGFASAFIIAAFLINFFFGASPYFGFRFFPSLLALILILITGIMDDFRPMAPRHKLILQILAALCVVVPGYSFERLFFIFDLERFPAVFWALYPLSFLWIVGVTNAINFIDGVDGLAGGISVLIALTYALLFTDLGNTGAAVLFCLCLAAVIVGFLLFNAPIPRAKIFMGDGGAYFLGFVLALLPLISAEDNPGLPLPYAAALLSIPIFDTFAAIWRRLRDGRRIDSPDRFHIHHKLMSLGLRCRGVLAALYGLQILVSALVYLSVKYHRGALSLALLALAYCAALGFFTAIHFMSRAAIRRRKKAGEPPGC
jgi:UDP-GlcNAc:undecaprenyl-phosphate GlcNAc-1-phosphate transferase